MMILRRLWFRIRSRLLLRRLTSTQRFAMEWELLSARLQRRLSKDSERIDGLRKQIDSLYETLGEDMEEAKLLESQRAAVVGTLKEQYRIASEVSMPALIASHQLILQRYEAEVAIQVRRQVGATLTTEE